MASNAAAAALPLGAPAADEVSALTVAHFAHAAISVRELGCCDHDQFVAPASSASSYAGH